MILEIKNLKKTYDKKTYALNDVSFSIDQSEFVVIIGPSGAGKSTLIRSINGLVQPTAGQVVFDGKNVEKAKGTQLKKIRRDIGMIFQHYNLIGPVTVTKNLLHGRLGHTPYIKSLFGLYSKEEKEQAISLLKTVGLSDHANKKASMLSGGQMQRVGICRALMQNPKLLLADEPIASLDPTSAKHVMDYMKNAVTDRAADRGLSCVCNLHQVDFAKKYATRIIGMKNGKIVFDDTPEKLTDQLISFIYEDEGEKNNEIN